jgi:opacity protein-like surface antigen
MRKLTSVAMLVAAVTLIPCLASAENFYAAIRGGPSFTPDNKSGLAGGGEDVQEYKLGFTGSGGVGYAFPFGLRMEGEFGFIYSPLKRDGGVDVDGSVKSYLVMANAYYDFKMPFLGPFKPYVGAGVGAARVNDDHQVFFDSVGLKFDVDHWRTALAYQARAGVIYDVNRWLDLSAGYRYVHIESGQDTFGPVKVNFGAINNHSVELGFAVKF